MKNIRTEDQPEEASDNDSESGSSTEEEEKKIKFTFKPIDIPVPKTKNPVKEIEIVETFRNKKVTERQIIYRMDISK